LAGVGKVLVVDNQAAMQVAVLGDLLAAAAIENGWQGVVVNGCIRDSADIAAMELGVKALACIPARGTRDGLGEVNVELEFLGAEFRPGDFLYSDEDGILLSARALI
jgi:regulator of ribonuclease activity A